MSGEVVFTFPGQGSYDGDALHGLYTRFPPVEPWFAAADAAALRLLGEPFLPLVTSPLPEERQAAADASPDLQQLGIYLAALAVAKLLGERGVRPALLLGHSFGELAALGAAEVFDVEAGIEIVCHRVLALRAVPTAGGMAALSCSVERAEALLRELGKPALEVAVLNHARQTVVSGPRADLEALLPFAGAQGVSLTLLKSRYPFHSSHLAPAVDRFERRLRGYELRPPRVPVWLAMEGRTYHAGGGAPELDLPALLASQLVRRLDFAAALGRLHADGWRRFVEVGAGEVLTKLVAKNLGAEVETVAALRAGEDVERGLQRVAEVLGVRPPTAVHAAIRGAAAVVAAPSSADELGEAAKLLREAAERIERVARLVRHAEAQGAPRETGATAAPEPAREAFPRPPTAAAREASPEPARAAVVAARESARDVTADARLAEGPRADPPPEPCPRPPIAVVALGCVLPGATNADELWRHVLDGTSGIVDLAALDPGLGSDFIAGSGGSGSEPAQIVSDKTYTLLSGAIRDVRYDAARLGAFYDEPAFAALTRGQKLLASAVAQALAARPANAAAPPARTHCILGATADGSAEYDEALFVEGVRRRLAELDLPAERRAAFATRLDAVGMTCASGESLRQHELYRGVVGRLLGEQTRTYVVDSACSSSLYSLALGIEALEAGDADVVVAGGVFAAGPANNTLFAQFRGLTPHASRPFDAAADGVVFGDGAAVVLLQRLPDAIASGARILGVIRAVGLSSDGKAPSVNVPQAAGQAVAIRRAYESSGIPLDSIQVVEAHATATPVGDAVEVRSLSEVFAARSPGLPRVQLGSVKALIGHTGWVSGVASLIKLLHAMAARTVPPQHNFTAPDPQLGLEASPFEISTRAKEWPSNAAPWPRRAGINGFGFGGTNAHLVVEEYDERYHRALCRGLAAPAEARPLELAVVGAAGLFPAAGELAAELTSDGPGAADRFTRAALRLPKGKLLLPDVREHMDPSQYLTALAAERIFAAVPQLLAELREEVGVVVGVEGKTERGITANERIFLDRLRRLAAASAPSARVREDEGELLAALAAHVRGRVLASGPYTLPGLMPNVAASRVSNLFALRGPNLVIDMGDESLFQAMAAAASLLAHGDCKVVLAGGLSAAGREGDREAIAMLALATPETARERGLPVLATLRVGESAAPAKRELDAARAPRHDDARWRAATGAVELLAALRRASDDGVAAEVVHRSGRGALRLTPTAEAAAKAAARAAASDRTPTQDAKLLAAVSNGHSTPAETPAASDAPATSQPHGTHAYVQGTPIETYTPVLVSALPTAAPAPFAGRKLLVLAGDAELWDRVAPELAIAGATWRVVSPADRALPGALTIDLDAADPAAAAATALAGVDFDTILALDRPSRGDEPPLLASPLTVETRLLDLLFVVCQHAYPALGRGEASVYGLSLDAFAGGKADAATGLLGGFLKSLARELPSTTVRNVCCATADPREALQQLSIELGQPREPVEVCWRGGRRETFALAPLQSLHAAGTPPVLGKDSVVLATGGARGVTAVLAEELLCRFGCTVIAVGRTDPTAVPPALAALSEVDFAAHEAAFYRDEMARDPRQKIVELKRRFAGYQGAHELQHAVRRLAALPGRFEYHHLDLLDEAEVTRLVDAVYARHGRLDMVVHGAGIQVSKVLPKKSLADFRRIVATKLGGLGAIWRAARAHAGATPVHYHLLTSAFSYLGNDGQPDYGAANEAMNRLAASLDGRGGASWSSMAWLGWAGIGMTRGSEFAALAANRRLRGVTHDEGREVFGRLVAGQPTAPVNVLLAAGERAFYRPAIAPAAALPRRPALSSLLKRLAIDLDNAPYLRDHLVQGVPTLPGAFLIGIAADAAHELRPRLRIVSFEDTSFRRFVRVYQGRTTDVRLDVRVVEEDEDETLLRVQVLADFVHKSGTVLQKDVVQTEIFVRMVPAHGTGESPPGAVPRAALTELRGGIELPDPYLLAGSPVLLNGRFKSLGGLRVVADRRLAHYRLDDSLYPSSPLQHMLPNVILVDAFWRFGTIMANTGGMPNGGHSLSVYVPERCERMSVYFDYTDFDLGWLHDPVVFTGRNPRPQGDQLLVGPIEAWDREGRLRLTVEGGVCRKFGEVEYAEVEHAL